MTPPLLAELRQATALQHRQLESRIRITESDIPLTDYAATLRAYLGFYGPIEARLEPVVRDIPDLSWPQRRKSHLLTADLARLTDVDANPGDIPQCAALPAVDNLAAATGLMYVLEGATLGGRSLLKTLGPRLTPSGATGFLEGYGGDTSLRWKQFIDFLWRVETPADRCAAVATAVATFTSFEQWLDDCGVLR